MHPDKSLMIVKSLGYPDEATLAKNIAQTNSLKLGDNPSLSQVQKALGSEKFLKCLSNMMRCRKLLAEFEKNGYRKKIFSNSL